MTKKQTKYFEAGKSSGVVKPPQLPQTPTGSAVGVWCCKWVLGADLVLKNGMNSWGKGFIGAFGGAVNI